MKADDEENSNIEKSGQNWPLLAQIGQNGPKFSSQIFRYLNSSRRQLSFDVQLSMALITFSFGHFWSFWPISANFGQFFIDI